MLNLAILDLTSQETGGLGDAQSHKTCWQAKCLIDFWEDFTFGGRK